MSVPVALPQPNSLEILWYQRRQRVCAALATSRLVARNRLTMRTARGRAPALVSMTSHGDRIAKCHVALESIASGSVRPRRLVLWLAKPDRVRVTPQLRRLAERGLDIRFDRDLGPHTKYFHALTEASEQLTLVTADDDIIYPRSWLADLLGARETDPEAIWCYRARLVGRVGGRATPYASWPLASANGPAHGLFFTGVGGAAYPRFLVRGLTEEGEAFLDTCPRADDIWLNHVALRLGIPVGIVGGTSRGQVAVARSQMVSLTTENVGGGGNDRAIQHLGFALI